MHPEANHGEVSGHKHWITGLLDVCRYGIFFLYFFPLLNRDYRHWYFKLEISPVKGKLHLTIIKVDYIL